MSDFRSVLPRLARSNGWRCFATEVPPDTIAELNKVRHWISLSDVVFDYYKLMRYLRRLLKMSIRHGICIGTFHLELDEIG
jgi:hypothetical protein